MLSRQSVPRIRVNLPDSSLSPSSTLDIKDVSGQAKLLPKLLAEEFVFDLADDDLHLEDGRGRMQHFPSFPMGRQPPLFILNPHRARLPFPIRPNAFELGDFCRDEEDACLLLTAPTVPRMKMMIKEQLYVQKWVDKLTIDSPPKHIPWTCEKPATKKNWIAEGSIFPAESVKSDKFGTEQREATQEHSCITDANRLPALTDQVSHSRELCSPPVPSTESHTPTSHVYTKSADVDPGILRGESKTSHTPRRIVRTSQALSPPSLLPSGSPLRTMSNTPDAPLAARRGKSLSGLKLKGCVIEHLEYPDIPTAFRGSPMVWSPRFDAFPVPSFTDHESMLLDLKSKCAAIGSGVSAYIQEPLGLQTESSRTSLSVDEWAFARGLATFDSNFLGSMDSQVPGEIIADTSIFLPDDSSTPMKGLSTAYVEFVPRLHSTPALQLPGNRSSPPGVPLPPRPALMNPSTPSHVRGILKKVKSVRFEEMTIEESENGTSPVVAPRASLEHLSPLSLAVLSKRPCTPTPNTAKPSSSPAPVKEAHGRNIQKKSAPRTRLPPKRTRANERLEPTHLKVGHAPETSKPTLATTSAERPSRPVHAKENTNPAAAPQAKQKASFISEIDVRRGIEGTTKSRLSVPLRNIFRFR
ncbi:hypothetical protein EV363DRAFT_25057 [Boletus edulis]|nr:hypothetical protein EV363DRAFT_25057 [Boletus edulis]